MHLKTLQLINFKNYEDIELSLSDGINCFTGPNGSGKTNVLDAIYYLSMCKSYLNSIDRQNIRFNEHFFVIQGNWIKEEKEINIHCAVKNGAKKVFKRNKNEYEKLADHIGQFPSVMISPYDRDLIIEGSETRRKWIDGIISQFNRKYLDNLQRYQKVVEQRNALLKNMYENRLFDRESIEVWNDQMSLLGTLIYNDRKSFLEEFIPIFQRNYNFIGLESEDVHLDYKSQLNQGKLEDLLVEFEQKDAFSQYSNFGIHKDDLLFTIKGHPVKKFGSQGQQKSFLIALKLAQYEWLKKHLEVNPVLLLDDIFDKLDNERVKRLMELVSQQHFGQVFVTDTDFNRIKKIFIENGFECKNFAVQNGEINEMKTLTTA